MPIIRLIPAAVVLGLFVESSAMAQSDRRDRGSAFEQRASGSLGAWVLAPTGELGDNIGTGIGLGGAAMFRLDRSGAVAIRADLGFGGYGQESKRVPLSPTVGGRVQVDVVTRNYVAVGSFGPQFTLPSGAVRPYVNGGAAFQVFFTESDVEGSHDSEGFASTTNQSDWTPAATVGGGVYVPLRYGRCPVLLDLGFTSYLGGHARYLKPGSIEDLPNSEIKITEMESATPFVLFRLGVKVGW